MARIYTEGFELGSAAVFDESYRTTLITPGRSGNKCLQVVSNAGGQGYARVYTGNTDEIFVRFAARFVGGVGGSPVTYFQVHDSSGTVIAQLRWVYGGPIRAYVNNVLVGTGSRPINWSWGLVEVHYKLNTSTSPANGVFQVKLEGRMEIDRTDVVTNPFTAGYLGKVSWINDWNYYDDIAINDPSGSQDNSWPGDGKILPVYPNGNGDSSAFDGSDGNSTDNYLLVDENTPDSDTTYVESLTSGATDLYAAQDISVIPGDTIKRVWVAALAKEASADGDSMQLGVKPSGAASPTWSTSQPLTENYEQHKSVEHSLNPYTSAAWTDTDINGLQIGIKVP